MEQGNPAGNTGERERLDKSAQPKDLILRESDDIGHNAGAVTRWDANITAIKTLKQIESEGRQTTPEEQKVMARFSGWGDSAFGQAFPASEGRYYNRDSAWGRRRDDLKSITTPEEFKAIEKSRENAFFTTPEVIRFMWQALESAGVGKLSNPRVLEPSAGSGRFLGYQPPEMAAKSARVAVELDDLTGRMLKQMYPRTEVYAGVGFERAPIPKESVDVAISNVPFGNIPIFDPTFKKEKQKLTRSIHNYFFAKTLDKLRPGGVLAFITSHQTLDAPSHKSVRQYLAKEADLIEAIRLPNNAFPDTQVVTDIIIMRKRLPGEPAGDQSWVDTIEKPLLSGKDYYGKETYADIPVNKYFAEHPEKVLGVPSAEGSMHGGYGSKSEYTVGAPATPLGTLLDKAGQKIPRDIIAEAPRREATKAVWTGNRHSEGAHVLMDNAVYVQKGESLVPADITGAEEGKVKGMLAIRDAAKQAVNIMVRDGSAAELEAAQKQLGNLYRAYVLEHGALTAQKNAGLLERDPDAPFLRALEDNNVFRKAKEELTEADERLIKVLKGSLPVELSDLPRIQTDIFSKRVIHGYTEKPITDYADAESVVKNETGRLDIPLMARKLGKSENDVVNGLVERNLIYKNPTTGEWEAGEEYLTGDVRGKLKVARIASGGKPREFDRNAEALLAVQPEEIPPSQIGARMGAPWIPSTDINEFVRELLDASEPYNRRSSWDEEAKKKQRSMLQYYHYNEITGEWALRSKPEASAEKLETFTVKDEDGRARMSATEIIERILNGQMIQVNDQVPDDKNPDKTKAVRNDKLTIVAQEKAAEIQRRFQDWIWGNQERAERLSTAYNDKFNNYRPRIFDGQHLILPGLSEKWSKLLHSHSKDAIWRVIQDRTALLAHEVGFGKTNVMVISGHELRRLGLAQKVLYVVPKATHEQFRDQYLDDYPVDRILFPGKDDFTPVKRQEFTSRAVTGDWDAIILSYEQFEKLPVRPETEAKFLQSEMDDLRDAIEQEINDNPDPRGKPTRTQKEIQKVLDRALVRMQKLNEKIADKSDKTLYFDDVGIDQMYVDEADNFKNLHYTTRMGRVKGLPNSDAQRAWDMYTKVRMLQENKTGGVVFATGTPIANTIAEMYTMQKYLQPQTLEEKGIKHFDAWAKTFGETTESLEQTPTGKYKVVQRFANFQNAPELSHMWQQFADIRVADEVPEMVRQRPRIVNEKGEEKRTVVPVPVTQELIDYMGTLAERADQLTGRPEKGGDNMLKISGDARKASLDMRLVDPRAKDNPNGKINVACNKIAQIYAEPFNKENKGTQLVFLDMGTPKAKADEEPAVKKPDDIPEDDNEETAEEMSLLKDVYSKIKNQLIANGIPENEIAFIHDAKTAKTRQTLFDQVNSGGIRVLIGSTGKMGVGVNVQQRACALHHIDAPWRPRDIEQREGRVIRTGNKVYGPVYDGDGNIIDRGKGVKIYTYVTERSFDEFMWQTIEKKSKSIKAIMRRSTPPRTLEDVDSFTASAAEFKAAASGNPDVVKANTLKNSVMRLQMLKSSAMDSRVRANNQLKKLPEIISANNESIKILEETDKLVKSKGESITIEGRQYADNKDGVVDTALREAVILSAIKNGQKNVRIGEYKGLNMNLEWDVSRFGPVLSLQNPNNNQSYSSSPLPVELIDTNKGNKVVFPESVKLLARIDNALDMITKSIKGKNADNEKHEKNIKIYTDQAAKPFEYEDRMNRMLAELNRVERRLQGENIEDTPSDNYVPEEDIQEETEPSYHYGARGVEPVAETVNPKAAMEAVKVEVETVEKQTEVKAPPASIEKVIDKIAEPVAEETKPMPEAQLHRFYGFYKDKKAEVITDTKYHAQEELAKMLKAKHSWDVAVQLVETDVSQADTTKQVSPKANIDAVPPDLPEIKNPVDTAKEENVVYGALNDTRSNAQIAKDMETNAGLVTPEHWEPEKNDLPGWDTTDIKEYQGDFEKAFPKVKQALEDTVQDSLTGRVKTLESMVKKLKKKNAKGEPFTQNNMEDIIGMRMTFDSNRDIMEAASAIKGKFKVTQDEDYITNPKSDGYRSYHLTIQHDGKPVEVQLRTPNQTKWADWMHDTFYDHPAETKARLGEDGFRRAREYSLAMADYYAKLDRGESAVMPEGLPDHPEFRPEPAKITSPFITKEEWPGMKQEPKIATKPIAAPETKELPKPEVKMKVLVPQVIQPDNCKISVSKLAKRIARAKTETQKNSLFLSVYGDDRTALLQHIILSMPPGKYLLKREGHASPSLEREIINKYGTFAGTHDLEKIVRGLSATHPQQVSADLTLGLDELTLKPTQEGQAVSRRPHKAKMAGSPPTPATEEAKKRAIGELREVNEKRLASARARDLNRAHSKVVRHTDPRVKRWVRDPGSMDVLRVDTPKGVKNPTLFRPRNPKIGRPTVESNVRSRKVGKIYVSRVKGDSGTMYSRKPVGKRRKKR